MYAKFILLTWTWTFSALDPPCESKSGLAFDGVILNNISNLVQAPLQGK